MDSVFMQFKFDILQTELHYFESQSLWVTVSYNYVVRGWKMKTYPEKTFEENFAIAAHKDKITSIYEVSEASNQSIHYKLIELIILILF